MAHTYATSAVLSYKHILCIETAYINCLAGSSDTYAGKTPVPDSGTLFAHPSIGEKPYYNNGLSLNGSIDLTSIGL